MSALALPLPFRAPLPPLPGGLAGEVGYWARVEQIINYLRSLSLLPNNVTTPPNPLPPSLGAFGSAAFWLIYLELVASASLGEEFPEGWDSVLNPGVQPVPEREPPGFVVPRGTSTYVGLRKVEIFRYYEVAKAAACPGGFNENGKILHDKNDSFFLRPPVDGTVEIENNSPSLNLNCGGSAANNSTESMYPMRARVLDADGIQIGDWIIPWNEPYPSGEVYEASNSGSRTAVIYGTEFNYDTEVQNYPPSRQPGPIVPQPDPFPDPEPIPTPWRIRPRVVEPEYKLVKVEIPLPVKETAPAIVRGLETTTLPAPPLPEDFPEVAPQTVPLPGAPPVVKPNVVTDTTLDGKPVPAPPKPVETTPDDEHFPWPGAKPVRPGGVPPTLKGIANEVGRIENKVGQLGQGFSGPGFWGWIDLINDIYEFLEILSGEKEYPGGNYFLSGVCEELNDEGEQPVFSTPVLGGAFTDAAISRLDAMQHLLQAHLRYKTPTCGTITKSPKEGTWISTRWVSDGDSDNSSRRLRKLFRYRSKSKRTAEELRGWWAPFTWTSGSTIVKHEGGWWGNPQVWASSADEGKRVLRFAGTEAGIDPDSVGEWIVTSTDDPRYGMSDTMRLAKPHGDYWVTRREGPSGFDL